MRSSSGSILCSLLKLQFKTLSGLLRYINLVLWQHVVCRVWVVQLSPAVDVLLVPYSVRPALFLKSTARRCCRQRTNERLVSLNAFGFFSLGVYWRDGGEWCRAFVRGCRSQRTGPLFGTIGGKDSAFVSFRPSTRYDCHSFLRYSLEIPTARNYQVTYELRDPVA
jgi:hypothetical protein